jgi:hypothetical protein
LIENTKVMITNTVRKTNERISTPIPIEKTVDNVMLYIQIRLGEIHLKNVLTNNLKREKKALKEKTKINAEIEVKAAFNEENIQ